MEKCVLKAKDLDFDFAGNISKETLKDNLKKISDYVKHLSKNDSEK